MKLISILLFVQTMMLITINAEGNSGTTETITKVSPYRKPVVDLKKKIITTTPTMPEERKKLSIFPKNPAKYIVTSKPYAKVRTYTVRPHVMTKKTLMPVYNPRATTKEPVIVHPAMRSIDSIVEFPPEVAKSRIHRRLVEEKHVNNNSGYKITQHSNPDNTNEIKDDSEEISTDLPEFADDELTKDIDNNVQIDFNTLSELDNLRIKRLAVQGPTVHDRWYFKNLARGPIDASHSHEINDESEFIFLNNKQKMSTNSQKSKSSRSMKGTSNSPSLASGSNASSRSKRSNNIIEEENKVTTASGFKYTGREPRITDDLVFKNIHA